MDYEKKYKDAVSKIKSIIADKKKQGLTNCLFEGDLNEIFPELKESEDERIRKALINYFDDANKVDENPLQNYGIHTDKIIAWLKKQGEQKPAWSEEDERMIRRIKQSLSCYKDKVCGCSLYDDVEAEINWLKSLKPQSHWKPTKEQLKFLINLSDNPSLYLEERRLLEELYNDLKKL